MVFFLVLEEHIRWVNSVVVVLQFLVSLAFLTAVVYRYRQKAYSKKILQLILLRYTLPHLSFCFLVFAIVH